MKTVLTAARIWADADDLTGHANSIELAAGYEALDATTFGSGGWRARVRGAGSATVKASGFLDVAADAFDPDAGVFAALEDGVPVPFTASVPGLEGDVAYMVPGVVSTWTPSAQHGGVAAWSIEAVSDQALARGRILADDLTARTATGALSGFVLPAVGASGRLLVVLHVLDVAGTDSPSVTVTVESAASADVSFSAPTSRVVFAAATTPGSQHTYAAGAITDTRYRVSLAVFGTNPSFRLAVSAGVTPS